MIGCRLGGAVPNDRRLKSQEPSSRHAGHTSSLLLLCPKPCHDGATQRVVEGYPEGRQDRKVVACRRELERRENENDASHKEEASFIIDGETDVSANLLSVAKQHRMNTNVRRAIFVATCERGILGQWLLCRRSRAGRVRGCQRRKIDPAACARPAAALTRAGDAASRSTGALRYAALAIADGCGTVLLIVLFGAADERRGALAAGQQLWPLYSRVSAAMTTPARWSHSPSPRIRGGEDPREGSPPLHERRSVRTSRNMLTHVWSAALQSRPARSIWTLEAVTSPWPAIEGSNNGFHYGASALDGTPKILQRPTRR
jgi:hypothetical protein